MAARWGTGEETLTIGGMEFFTAGGPHQCHGLGEDESCDGLSDLAMSSLDAAGILGNFQGYIDNSFASIINDIGAQAENKDPFDEDDELSLLTALTEILDNVDDENMSPFDSIPDAELLVSPKDRISNLIDGCYAGPNWDLFPDTINATPKRHNRHKMERGCLPRRPRVEPNRPRSDGEDEELPCIEKIISTIPRLLGLDKEFPPEAESRELEGERPLKHGTPCIINTENCTLNDLVKYMHPYSLPAITVCLEQEDSDSLLNEAVFLEIVSEEGESIKVPVVVEHPGEGLDPGPVDDDDPPTLASSEEMDFANQPSPVTPPVLERFVPERHQEERESVEDARPSEDLDVETMNENECKSQEMRVVPSLRNITTKPLADKLADTMPSKSNDVGSVPNDVIVTDCQNNQEPLSSTAPVTGKERVMLKGKKSSKDKQSKSKGKSKNKGAGDDKTRDAPDKIVSQSSARSLSNPTLQESDFIVKTLDQVKDSQMELRSSKLGRSRARTRLDGSNLDRKTKVETGKKRLFNAVEKDQTKGTSGVADVCSLVGGNAKLDGSQQIKPDCASESPVSEDTSGPNTSASEIPLKETPATEELSPSAREEAAEEDSAQSKEAKPKSLSLSEYRKRLQHRKSNPERESDGASCSKWPSVPEPPTELAELPCLIVPTKSVKPPLDETPSIPNKAEDTPEVDVAVGLNPVPSNPTSPPVSSQLKPNEAANPTAVEITPPPMIPAQPNVPPPFYPPAWPNIPPYPAYYPAMPPLPVVPHFPNCMPPIMPMQPPPPVPSWPSYPPPPIPVGPVPPIGWVPGIPPPPPPSFWPSPQLPPRMPDTGCMQMSPETSVPINTSNLHGTTDQVSKDISEYSIQNAAPAKSQSNQAPMQNPDIKESKVETQECGALTKSSTSDLQSTRSKSAEKVQPKPPVDSKTSINAPDPKSATNQVVLKIMEILKKAEKHGFRIKSPLVSSAPVSSASSGGEKPVAVSPKPTRLEQSIDKTQTTSAAVEVKPPQALPAECVPSKEPLMVEVLANPEPQKPVPPSSGEDTPGGSAPPTPTLSEKPEETSAWDSGIEASDLSSLLEEFEKYEAKDEKCLPHNPDKLAVGISGPLEGIHERHPAPALDNTAAVNTIQSGPSPVKAKSSHGPQRSFSSALKTAKLIEALPQSRLRIRNSAVAAAAHVSLPPVHVASGEHDYCILSAARPGQAPAPVKDASPCDEGSRWNVKHHQHITIKPIVQFNNQHNIPSSKMSTTSAPSVVIPAINGGLEGPVAATCHSIQRDRNDPLDHRIPDVEESAASAPPGPASPDSLSSHESRTDVTRENDSVSRRSLRCYRKQRSSPSPPKSTWSRSSSAQSSSRSRSRSPPSKRRRTYRSRSHHRSRSSSGSSYSTSSSSRSSSPSSRSCSSSSSRSRSRSRSPHRQRYRSTSRGYMSRDSYQRQTNYRKERAIEERRVVYIGKINSHMTRSELRDRFSVFGEIEDCTLHFRDHGDNYGFVTYRCTEDAFDAIENGHKLRLPDELPFDLCFGGRRQFCKSNYADLDSNRSDFDPAPVRSTYEALDFETLLREAQKSHRR